MPEHNSSSSSSSVITSALRRLSFTKPAAAAPAAEPTPPPTQRRVFLFSDGLANVGLSNRPGLLQFVESEFIRREVPLTTFGVGADFDELLMEQMADKSFGNHFFIDQPSMTSTYVNAALNGLLGVLGRKAVLRVRGADGVVVEAIYGCTDLKKGIEFGDIKANNTKSILAKCAVQFATAPDDADTSVPLVHFALEYTPIDSAGAELPRVTLEGSLRTLVTFNETDAAEQHPTVALAVTTEEEARRDEEVEAALRRGDVTSAMQSKEAEIARWTTAASYDTSGKAAHMKKRAEVHLARIKTEGASKSNMVQMRQNVRQKRRQSTDYMMCDAAEYAAM